MSVCELVIFNNGVSLTIDVDPHPSKFARDEGWLLKRITDNEGRIPTFINLKLCKRLHLYRGKLVSLFEEAIS